MQYGSIIVTLQYRTAGGLLRFGCFQFTFQPTCFCFAGAFFFLRTKCFFPFEPCSQTILGLCLALKKTVSDGPRGTFPQTFFQNSNLFLELSLSPLDHGVGFIEDGFNVSAASSAVIKLDSILKTAILTQFLSLTPKCKPLFPRIRNGTRL